MWKLTIIQKKQYETFETDQEVVYTSECIEALLLMINASEKLEPKKTVYKIEKESEQ